VPVLAAARCSELVLHKVFYHFSQLDIPQRCKHFEIGGDKKTKGGVK
jgi:hypothetical protein